MRIRHGKFEEEVMGSGRIGIQIYESINGRVWADRIHYKNKTYYAVNYYTSRQEVDGALFTVKGEALSFAKKMAKKYDIY